MSRRADAARRGRRWLIPMMAAVALALPLLLVSFDGAADWIRLTEPTPYPPYAPPPDWLPDWLARTQEEWATAKAHWEENGPAAMPLVLFFLFLPALNAPFDWLSLAVSRTLLRWTAEAPRWLAGPVGLLPAKIIHLVVIGFDAFVALVLACLIVFATAFGVAVIAKLHLLGGASGIGFVVSERIAEIRADPLAKDHWWIYAMMFWTLVPTIVHLIAYAAGFVAAVIPSKWRAAIARLADSGARRPLRALVGGGALAGLRLLPGLALLYLAADNFERTLSVLGSPFELFGKLPGVDFACTEDFTVETLGTCLADGSEALAKWVESR